MNIELQRIDRMTFNGRGVLRSFQNTSSPNIDLLVRESLQNSLDASRNNTNPVVVDFEFGKFIAHEMNQHFDGISQELNKRYKESYDFLAIRDRNTIGLTGPLSHSDVKANQDYGNLLKLVYDLSKQQVNKGSGGSYGYGKTIYFRIGIGIVLFYSRIIENNEYKERLAAILVEDQQNTNAILHAASANSTGIAWWGDGVGDGKTQPITDSERIAEILNVFGLKRYEGINTGTTIIIPYVDKEKLLKHNAISEEVVSWYGSAEDYLKYSVQRWYAPRLNNCYYRFGNMSNLIVRINGEAILGDNENPLFRYIREMYNFAITKNKKSLETLEKISAEVNVDSISVNKPSMKEREVGRFVYTKLSYQQLGLKSPSDIANPPFLTNINVDMDDLDGYNKPIICFTRKPGMIVNYQNNSEWVDESITTAPGEFIIGIFVLNSTNIIYDGNEEVSLEEYIRLGEKADHTEWFDGSAGDMNFDIVKRIKQNVKRYLTKHYKVDDIKLIVDTDAMKISKLIGDKIMPKFGFGNKSTRKPRGTSDGSKGAKHVSPVGKMTVYYDNPKFEGDIVKLPFSFKGNKDAIASCNIVLEIEQDGTTISIPSFEDEMGYKSPVELLGPQVTGLSKLTPAPNSKSILAITRSKPNNSIYKATLNFMCTKGLEFSGTINIRSKSQMINTKVKVNIGEGM